ncbi:sporulation protein YunB [Lihuaxuella thermophila]|uniref:Sporulation protein YunB n=1 Tax=Lihuaxuella thermophila TaxID=1173111 RepID=A0A1H8HIN1_9BACL|nr:sporulation protein YunB [Lihuaxuella thermophila]SEN56033.1 sporulation protein YunB [Lihuaxuella thermophila]
MLFRRRLIRRKPRSFRVRKRGSFLFFALVMLLAVIIQIVWMIERNLEPMLLAYAKTTVKGIAMEAVRQGVHDMQRSLGNELDQIMAVDKDANGRITGVKINQNIQAQIYNQMTESVMKELNHLKDHPVEISVGQMLQSNIFAGYGPDIPVEMWLKGAPKVSLIPKLESHGINMVMVTLNLHIHNEMGVMVPFSKESILVDVQYPIAQSLVVGEVPEYYFYNDQGQMKKGEVGSPAPPPPAPALPATKHKD